MQKELIDLTNKLTIDTKLISIMMPVKNAGLYLVECLDSIINQEYKHWELIAINDHSTDDSENILETYANKDVRISFKKNSGSGIIDALRLAYSLSSGNFITRMDADDIMTSNKLRIMQTQLADYQQGHIALGQVKYFSENELGDGYKKYAAWLNSLIVSGENWKDIFRECVIPSPCWMVYRTDFNKAGAFDNDLWPEDYDLCFRFYMAGLKCIPTEDILHHWRDYGDRTSRNDPHYADNRFFELKLHYFLKMYPRSDQNLVLMGAGKKGKQIAKKLVDEKLDFNWLSNNEKKIGKEIYGLQLQSEKELLAIKNPIIIIAISNPSEQKLLEELLLNQGLIKGHNYHFFS